MMSGGFFYVKGQIFVCYLFIDIPSLTAYCF
jgi:hypothetical protein